MLQQIVGKTGKKDCILSVHPLYQRISKRRGRLSLPGLGGGDAMTLLETLALLNLLAVVIFGVINALKK